MVGSFLKIIILVIAGTILFVAGYMVNSTEIIDTENMIELKTDFIERVDSLDCNELWEEILENEKKFGTVGDRVFAKWIAKECWS